MLTYTVPVIITHTTETYLSERAGESERERERERERAKSLWKLLLERHVCNANVRKYRYAHIANSIYLCKFHTEVPPDVETTPRQRSQFSPILYM